MKKFIMLMLLMLATLAHASADADPQPYAVLDNGTLTFYCDNQTRSGAMPLNKDYEVPEWRQYASEIITVEFHESFSNARPMTCKFWFSLCENLTEIKGIQYLNTSEVTNMSYMFESCFCLQSLDLSSFNTAKVDNMEMMFSCCYALKTLDLSSFNTAMVTDMNSMFDNSNFKTILVGSGWNVAKVTSSNYMFNDCTYLTGGNGTKYEDDNPDDKTYAVIDGKDGNPGYLTSLEQCTPYAELIDNPDGATKTLVFRFGIKPDNAMSLNDDYTAPDWNNNASKITTVEFDPLFQYYLPTSCYKWFYDCENLTEIKGIQYLNTSEVTNMNQMFRNCESIESLNLSSFNTEKVDDMYFIFAYCKALKSLNLSSFNTEKVDDMSSMFYNCSALTSLDLNSINTERVMILVKMFSNCSALKTILVGDGWNVDKVTLSDNMFSVAQTSPAATAPHLHTITSTKPTPLSTARTATPATSPSTP